MLGVVSQTTGQYNYDREGNFLPAGEAGSQELRDERVRVLRAGQLAARATS